MYANAGDVNGARGVMQQMRDAGVQPEIYSFNLLLHVYANAGDVNGARGVMQEMRDAGV